MRNDGIVVRFLDNTKRYSLECIGDMTEKVQDGHLLYQDSGGIVHTVGSVPYEDVVNFKVNGGYADIINMPDYWISNKDYVMLYSSNRFVYLHFNGETYVSDTNTHGIIFDPVGERVERVIPLHLPHLYGGRWYAYTVKGILRRVELRDGVVESLSAFKRRMLINSM